MRNPTKEGDFRPLVRGLHDKYIPAPKETQGTEYFPRQELEQVFQPENVLLQKATTVGENSWVLHASPVRAKVETSYIDSVDMRSKDEVAIRFNTSGPHAGKYYKKLYGLSPFTVIDASKYALTYLLSTYEMLPDIDQVRITYADRSAPLPVIPKDTVSGIRVVVKMRDHGQCLADVLDLNKNTSLLSNVQAQTVPKPARSDATFPIQEAALLETMLQFAAFSMTHQAGVPIFPTSVTIEGATFNRRPAPRNDLAVLATVSQADKTKFSGIFRITRTNVEMVRFSLSCEGAREPIAARLIPQPKMPLRGELPEEY